MVFNDSKYTRWYNQLIEQATVRILPRDVYTEKHHIIPQSLGGNNSIDNVVKLTAREHFVCHWLLTKMVTGENNHFFGKKHTEETLAKLKVPKPKLQCQHCKKIVGGQANLIRWHNDNCKLLLGESKFHA